MLASINLALLAAIGILMTVYLLRRRTRITTSRLQSAASSETADTPQ